MSSNALQIFEQEETEFTVDSLSITRCDECGRECEPDFYDFENEMCNRCTESETRAWSRHYLSLAK